MNGVGWRGVALLVLGFGIDPYSFLFVCVYSLSGYYPHSLSSISRRTCTCVHRRIQIITYVSVSSNMFLSQLVNACNNHSQARWM